MAGETVSNNKDQLTIQEILRRDDAIKAGALTRAIDFHYNNSNPSAKQVDDETIVKTAQKFEDYLRGKTEKE